MTLIDTTLYRLLMQLWQEAEGLTYTRISDDRAFQSTLEALETYPTAQQGTQQV